ncbi:MAG: alpha/beta hydrolase [Leucobacter sp.]
MRRPRGFTSTGVLLVLLLSVACGTSACAATEAEGNVMAAVDPLIVTTKVPGPAAQGLPGSNEVPVRIYMPGSDALALEGGETGASAPVEPWATLIWAHGGSFLRGTLDWPEADWVAQQFAGSGMRVLSVDYALASDTVKAPAPSNDVAAVVAWAANEYAGPLIVGGASAGAHLAVVATLDQLDRAATGAGVRQADALILQYPTLHRVQRENAAIAAATAKLPEARQFDAERIAEMYSFYVGDSSAPIAGELPPARLAGLPATVIVNADADDLRASAEEFAEQLRFAGVVVSESIQPETVHGYLNRPLESEQATIDALATIDTFVNELRRTLVL